LNRGNDVGELPLHCTGHILEHQEPGKDGHNDHTDE